MAPRIEHFDLEKKRALVLGADTPAGGAIARAYAEAGARVALCVPGEQRARAAAEIVAKDIAAMGRQSTVCVLEGATGSAVDDLVARVAESHGGGLDMAAFCAESFVALPIEQTTDDDLQRALTANFGLAFCLARAAVPHLRAAGPGGSLTLVSHVLGERGLPNTAAYGAAQAATQGLVRALSQELAPSRISVNGIALGWMDWMGDRLDPEDAEAQRAIRFTIAKRTGRPDDVGPLAVWLAGSGNGYVTGQIFALDGGLLQHL